MTDRDKLRASITTASGSDAAATPPEPKTDRIEAAAQYLVQTVERTSWIGIRPDGRAKDDGFEPFHTSQYSFSVNGNARQEDYRDVVREIARLLGDDAAQQEPKPVCCYCDAPLCCSKCGMEQPDDSAISPAQTRPDLLLRARQFVADSGCDEDDNEVNAARDEILAEMEAALTGGAQQPAQPRWRHKKRGSTYTEVGRGNLQIATDPVEEDDRVVIYRADTDGRLWVRGEAEFGDGRFEALPMSSTDRGGK